MNSIFLLRLVFDLTAASLLLLGLAYWWLGNALHELAGTAMFLLLIVHNVFNRRWYGAAARSPRAPRSLVNIGVTVLLLTGMLALLVTSVLISNALSGVLPAPGFTARQIHVFAGYWVLVIVAIHLGLRWPMLVGLARSVFGIARTSAARTFVLRALAAGIAIHGVWSSFALGIGGKLAMQMTLDWWNFEESVAGFFVHCVAIAGLYIFVTYYMMKWTQRRARTAMAAPAPAAS